MPQQYQKKYTVFSTALLPGTRWSNKNVITNKYVVVNKYVGRKP